MTEYAQNVLSKVRALNPSEPEFHQAVEEVFDSLDLVLERHPEYRSGKNPGKNDRTGKSYYVPSTLDG